MCELMEYPEKTTISDFTPEFSWIVNSATQNDLQTAYQILVASQPDGIKNDTGDLWDTGKVKSDVSINVEYNGAPLQPNITCYWKVKTWDKHGAESPWSAVQTFRTATQENIAIEKDQHSFTNRYPLVKNEVKPVNIIRKKVGHYFVDFGKAAFGTVKLTLDCPKDNQTVEIHLGEVLKDSDTIDREPGGSRRYRLMHLPVQKGLHPYTVRITPDKRNTGDFAIKMPSDIGDVMPFRYCELVNCPFEIDASKISQIVVTYPFNDIACRFESSDRVLNDVWELCKYSIKATSFCGVYVDGDRERIPYEADAYINQLGHYSVDREFTMARFTHEYLMTHATWPTEWILHSVLLAWADYLYTGNKESIVTYYDDLKAKTLVDLAREDGLISTQTGLVSDDLLRAIHLDNKLRDIVDWPSASFGGDGVPGERDGYILTDINTVVNTFHYRALVLMAEIAQALDNSADAEFFAQQAEKVKASINAKLFDTKRGIYKDGEETDHVSLHANMFPLAFGIVPDEYKESVVEFIKTRGMACSVYGSQFLLEALYEAHAADYAFSLLTSTAERSWAHMIYGVGSTISLEAWDNRFKPNQDWNHAWGAAPANIIPRYLMGIRPLEPGFSKVLIKPQPGSLKCAAIDLPTIRGSIHVDFTSTPKEAFTLNVTIPANVQAQVHVPVNGIDNPKVKVDGIEHKGRVEDGFVVLESIGSGKHCVEVGR
ncbi:MAG: alpha-L-rhamnosidase [Candidatus Latescibacteria bacterium]|nr:alpha-L-rhamnosidase [Candidatus Latescibacterota bacterium]